MRSLPFLYVWIVLLWPYLVAAIAVGVWLIGMRRQLEGKLAYAILAFIACMVANNVVELGAYYVIPVDVAGTPPPDPRNVHMRFLMVAAAQLPLALALAYFIARRFSPPSRPPA